MTTLPDCILQAIQAARPFSFLPGCDRRAVVRVYSVAAQHWRREDSTHPCARAVSAAAAAVGPELAAAAAVGPELEEQ